MLVEDKQKKVYQSLVNRAAACMRCPAMSFGRTFLNEHNGSITADIMFVGEATNVGTDDMLPRPFDSSPSGDNFDLFLQEAGIDRESVFVTNTVLHTPVTPKGSMRTVHLDEMQNCSLFLAQQILIVDPIIVVPMGRSALIALDILEKHPFKSMSEAICNCIPWNGRWMIPLYHPSPNVVRTWRPVSKQILDYKFLAQKLEEIKHGREN